MAAEVVVGKKGGVDRLPVENRRLGAIYDAVDQFLGQVVTGG